MLSAPFSAAKDKTDTDKPAYEKMELFADALAIIQDRYVTDTTPDALIENALNGALSSLDPHSAYVPPTQFTQQRKAARREYGGIGIEVQMKDGLVHVNHAIEDGPAYAAGIRAGDLITRVDGDPIKDQPLEQAVSGIRGLVGDPVIITIISPETSAREVSVTRATVQGRAVRHRIKEGWGYLQIETFNNENLTRDTKRALKDLERQLGGDIPGLIIDLRGNRGGLLTQSIHISSLFLDGGEVLSARGRDMSDTQRYNAAPGELYPNIPIIVLMNSGSASAAEIVAGALQDRGRAIVLGRRSFGKGSVQSVIAMAPISDTPEPQTGGALRLTTQRYYTPSGNSIQGRGIMPDLLVAALPDSGEIRKAFREDSLRNFLINPDDTDYEEDHADVAYPPEDWDITQDFQLQSAIKLLQDTQQYQTLLEAQTARYK